MNIIKDDLYYNCVDRAEELILRGYPVGNVSVIELAETLWKLEIEKNEKNKISDKNLFYNDEIVEIEEVGELETIDISVSGDNLFYCNGILTKNSFGLPATADMMFALVSSEELEAEGLVMVKQLKNRYSDPNLYKRFTIAIEKKYMRLKDADSQIPLVDDTPQQITHSQGRDHLGLKEKAKGMRI